MKQQNPPVVENWIAVWVISSAFFLPGAIIGGALVSYLHLSFPVFLGRVVAFFIVFTGVIWGFIGEYERRRKLREKRAGQNETKSRSSNDA